MNAFRHSSSKFARKWRNRKYKVQPRWQSYARLGFDVIADLSPAEFGPHQNVSAESCFSQEFTKGIVGRKSSGQVATQFKPGKSELLLNIFGCRHKRMTRPITPVNKPGAEESGTYVVCLDCGRQFVYELTAMRVGPQVAASPRAEFLTRMLPDVRTLYVTQLLRQLLLWCGEPVASSKTKRSSTAENTGRIGFQLLFPCTAHSARDSETLLGCEDEISPGRSRIPAGSVVPPVGSTRCPAIWIVRQTRSSHDACFHRLGNHSFEIA